MTVTVTRAATHHYVAKVRDYYVGEDSRPTTLLSQAKRFSDITACHDSGVHGAIFYAVESQIVETLTLEIVDAKVD
jgi:hypothetical protein